jgi:hypothetical protein
MEVVGYELQTRGDRDAGSDPITALERLRDTAAAFPATGAALADVYPDVVRLAAQALLALGSMPEPDEIDGLRGFEGFDIWRQSR